MGERPDRPGKGPIFPGFYFGQATYEEQNKPFTYAVLVHNYQNYTEERGDSSNRALYENVVASPPALPSFLPSFLPYESPT